LLKNPDCLAKAKELGDDMTALAAYACELGYEVTAEDLFAFGGKTRQILEAKWKELDANKESLTGGAKQFMEFSKLADSNPEVAKRVTELSGNPQELIAYGKEKGFIFDAKDMEEVAKKLMEQDEELSDDELESAAGGIVVVLGSLAVCGLLVVGLVASAGVVAATAVAIGYDE